MAKCWIHSCCMLYRSDSIPGSERTFFLYFSLCRALAPRDGDAEEEARRAEGEGRREGSLSLHGRDVMRRWRRRRRVVGRKEGEAMMFRQFDLALGSFALALGSFARLLVLALGSLPRLFFESAVVFDLVFFVFVFEDDQGAIVARAAGASVVVSGVAGAAAARDDEVEEGVLLAVDQDLVEVEVVAGGVSLDPELLPRRRKQNAELAFDRQPEGLVVRVGEDQHLPRRRVLDAHGHHARPALRHLPDLIPVQGQRQSLFLQAVAAHRYLYSTVRTSVFLCCCDRTDRRSPPRRRGRGTTGPELEAMDASANHHRRRKKHR
mmetsp:Transcript_9165/g.29721  ORF Transcript_9165/g.29721 Transcript_9165/m.29721 type:complete len:321 (-) Transcript_9165:17-979(-)